MRRPPCSRRKGYQAATLNDVAAALDTDRATLYYYVSGKEELLREAVSAYVLAIVADIRRLAVTDAPAPDKLREFITRVMVAYEAHYPHPYVFIQEKLDEAFRMGSDWARELIASVTELQHQVVHILEQGVRDGELRPDLPVDLVVNAMFGMVNWSHRWFRPGHRYSGAEIGSYLPRSSGGPDARPGLRRAHGRSTPHRPPGGHRGPG